MKTLNAVLLVLLVAGLMAGCAGAPAPQPAPTTAPAAAAPTSAPAPTAAPAATAVPPTAAPAPTAAPVPTEAPAPADHTGGTLTIAVTALKQFDPMRASDGNSFLAVSNIFSTLFRNNDKGESIPDLATSWKYDDDTTVIFTLRKGVMFHDDNEVFAKGQSREVTADDVVYSIKRAMETKGAVVFADLKGAFKDIEAVDKYTVKLTLNAPDAYLFTTGLGLSNMAIVAKEAVEKLGDQFGQTPIGSGPFKFESYQADDSLVLVRNELYWQKPNLDKLVFKVVPEPSVAALSLETGEIDATTNGLASDYDRLSKNPDIALINSQGASAAQILFNMKNAVYSEVKFRQAFAYALDTAAIEKNVAGSLYVEGCGTAGPGVAGWLPDLCQRYFGYQPDKAKALLGELGYKPNASGMMEKDGAPLKVAIETMITDPYPQMGAAIVTQLKQVGIDAELMTLEVGTWAEDLFSGADRIFMFGGFSNDGGMSDLWGQYGIAPALFYDDKEVFDLLAKADATIDPAARKPMMEKATDLIFSKYWATSIGFKGSYSAYRTTVHDFEMPTWWLNVTTEKNNVWDENKD